MVRWTPHPLSRRSVALLVAAALILGVGLPLLIKGDAALEITRTNARGSLPDGFSLYRILDGRGIKIKSITPAKDSVVIRLDSSEQALAAETVLQERLPERYAISRSKQFGPWLWHYRPAKAGRVG